MKKIIGFLLLAALVAALGAGYMLTASKASADPPTCNTTCDPAVCPIRCQNQGYDTGSCVKTGPHCYDCQCRFVQ